MKAHIAALAFGLLFSMTANSTYDANITGVVTDVLTYSNGRISIKLDNQPTTHDGCNPAYFSIDTSITADIKARMLSRLLTAHTTKQAIIIGYAASGDCADGYIRIYRAG